MSETSDIHTESATEKVNERPDVEVLRIKDSYRELRESPRKHKKLAVAFSGGVDSTLLLKATHDVLGDDSRLHGILLHLPAA